MSRQHPTDFSAEDVKRRVCRACRITPGQLVLLDFPTADYENENGRFWRAAAVQSWVRAHARAEIESRPGELRELMELKAAVRRFSPAMPPLPEAELREQTIRDYEQARIVRSRLP
jgi:hypothetical protein